METETVAVGYGALNGQNHTSSTDNYNVAVGYTAGNNIQQVSNNTLIGTQAGDANTTGEHNVCIGYEVTHDTGGRTGAMTLGSGGTHVT